MIDRCAFSELPIDQCDHCRGGRGSRPPAAPARGAMQLHARYPGRCAGCGEPFDAGTLIRWTDYDANLGEGGWIAECCADSEDPDGAAR